MMSESTDWGHEMHEQRLLFTKAGLLDLHAGCHGSLRILFDHASTVPSEPLRVPLPGFGIATVWKQFLHILEVEESWVLDLQGKAWESRGEGDCESSDALFKMKTRVQKATQDYLESLSETKLNRPLGERPAHWVGACGVPPLLCCM